MGICEKYIRRNVQIGLDKYTPVMVSKIKSPSVELKSDEGFGNHNFMTAWFPISEPFVMESETFVHDFDQFLIFLGGDAANMLDLGGEVELTLGQPGEELETYVFTTATTVYIPAGLLHCPLNFKKVNDPNRPILFQDLILTLDYKKFTPEEFKKLKK